jgi:FKBP-type peptidyl-prolyl cis-trans isomerase
LFSCQKEDQTAAQQLEMDITIIEEYLANHGWVAESTASGLHYIIVDPGSGTSYPTSQSKVTVAYIGSLADGTIFEESVGGNPPTFYLNQVIKGWQEGIPKFRKGGKGKLLIPSGLAYGPNSPSSKIPPNAVLIFDIQLINIQ